MVRLANNAVGKLLHTYVRNALVMGCTAGSVRQSIKHPRGDFAHADYYRTAGEEKRKDIAQNETPRHPANLLDSPSILIE
jgi:hypothetical protein